MKVTVKGWVSGKVQRVFYRATVQEACLNLGLTGYAKNLPDGRVEVMLCGDEEAVKKGQEAVIKGSAASRVDAVDWQSCSPSAATEDFLYL
jgi:acylphosphatase